MSGLLKNIFARKTRTNPWDIKLKPLRGRSLAEWRDGIKRSDDDLSGIGQQKLSSDLDTIFSTLTRCPSFQTLCCDDPYIEDVPVSLEQGIRYKGNYHSEGRISLSLFFSSMGYYEWSDMRGNYTHVLAHEYRHAAQHGRGVLYLPLTGLPELITQSYVVEADARAFQLTVAWEAGLMGDGRAILSLKHDKVECYDAFIGAIQDDPASFYDGRAQDAAFKQWFLDGDLLALYAGTALSSVERMLEMPYEAILGCGGEGDGNGQGDSAEPYEDAQSAARRKRQSFAPSPASMAYRLDDDLHMERDYYRIDRTVEERDFSHYRPYLPEKLLAAIDTADAAYQDYLTGLLDYAGKIEGRKRANEPEIEAAFPAPVQSL
ncbi:MAG: DUF6782 family putative metallopeptidase [Micavibrio sp.]